MKEVTLDKQEDGPANRHERRLRAREDRKRGAGVTKRSSRTVTKRHSQENS